MRTYVRTHAHSLAMQEVACERVIPKIVCTRASFCDDDLDNEANNNNNNNSISITNNNNNCEGKRSGHLARQKKIARSRVRRNSRRLTLPASECGRRSSSSSRSPSPICPPRSQRSADVAEDEEVKNLRNCCEAPGYRQYLELLDVPTLFGNNVEWSEPSGDDLSSEWDSDQSFKSEKIEDEEIDNRTVVTKVHITNVKDLL